MRPLFSNLIDLDESDAYDNLGAKERLLTLHLVTCYVMDRMSNYDLIDLKVFIGLLPAIPFKDQKALPSLTLEVASIGLTCTDTSPLFKAIIIMEEIKRIFSLDEQLIILKELTLRKK